MNALEGPSLGAVVLVGLVGYMCRWWYVALRNILRMGLEYRNTGAAPGEEEGSRGACRAEPGDTDGERGGRCGGGRRGKGAREKPLDCPPARGKRGGQHEDAAMPRNQGTGALSTIYMKKWFRPHK